MKNISSLTEYKMFQVLYIWQTLPVFFVGTWRQVCVIFFIDKAPEASSGSDAHPNGSRVQDFVFITGCRNSFFLKRKYSQLNISALSL